MTLHLPPSGMVGPQYNPQARLATPAEVRRDKLQKPFESLQTVRCALAHAHAKDHTLGRLEDTLRTVGVAGIAGLSSLGVSQTGGSIPLWLGAASWLGGMGATQKLVQAGVRWKTGVPVDMPYMTSNGEIKPLFLDPNYMPLQVLPPETLKALAERLKVQGKPEELPEKLHPKLKQIAVQTHTWWMLVAGIATPLLASMFCDIVEEPLKDTVTHLRYQMAKARLHPQAMGRLPEKEVVTQTSRLVASTLGGGTEITKMSRWWRGFALKLNQGLALNQLPEKTLHRMAAPDGQAMVAEHLYEALNNPKQRQALEQLIRAEQGALQNVLNPVEQIFRHPILQKVAGLKTPEASTVLTLKQSVQLERAAAESTLKAVERLLAIPTRTIAKSEAISHIRQQLDLTLPYLETLNRTGRVKQAARLMGRSLMDRVLGTFFKQEFANAEMELGATMAGFFRNNIRSLGLRKQWVRRYPLTLGGGMLVASALFMTLMLGRDFGGNARREGSA